MLKAEGGEALLRNAVPECPEPFLLELVAGREACVFCTGSRLSGAPNQSLKTLRNNRNAHPGLK